MDKAMRGTCRTRSRVLEPGRRGPRHALRSHREAVGTRSRGVSAHRWATPGGVRGGHNTRLALDND